MANGYDRGLFCRRWRKVLAVQVPRLGVAIITMGNRPREVDALLASVAKQDVPPARIVIVGNGSPLPAFSGLPGEVTVIELAENLGCPGGRNIALARLQEFGDIDVVVELDDDGLLVEADVFRTIRDQFARDPRLGIIGFRIADESGETQRRHVPRLRATDPMRGGPVTAFLGGAHAFSLEMLAEIGLWPEQFFFTHEETDLAWRALDAGWTVRYEPQLLLQHPKTSPARHAVYFRMTARNRVWLARRRLPAVLISLYLGVWTLLTLVRTRSLGGLRAWAGGFIEGVRTPAGERRPMSWRTVAPHDQAGPPPDHLRLPISRACRGAQPVGYRLRGVLQPPRSGRPRWRCPLPGTCAAASPSARSRRSHPGGRRAASASRERGTGVVSGGQPCDVADAGGRAGADVQGLAVGVGGDECAQGAFGDVVDVHQVPDLMPAAVQVERQAQGCPGREPRHHPRVRARLDDLRLAVDGEVAHDRVRGADGVEHPGGLSLSRHFGVGVHRHRVVWAVLVELRRRASVYAGQHLPRGAVFITGGSPVVGLSVSVHTGRGHEHHALHAATSATARTA